MIQNLETLQAVKVIAIVKRLGIAESEAEVGRTIGYVPQNINQIKSGKRNVPPEIIRNLIKSYQVNPSFVFKNELPVFDQSGTNSHYNSISDPTDKDIHTRLKEIENNQSKIMDALKKGGLL